MGPKRRNIAQDDNVKQCTYNSNLYNKNIYILENLTEKGQGMGRGAPVFFTAVSFCSDSGSTINFSLSSFQIWFSEILRQFHVHMKSDRDGNQLINQTIKTKYPFSCVLLRLGK